MVRPERTGANRLGRMRCSVAAKVGCKWDNTGVLHIGNVGREMAALVRYGLHRYDRGWTCPMKIGMVGRGR